jgi:hypothetical protein
MSAQLQFWLLFIVIAVVCLHRHRIRYWIHLLMEQGWVSTVHYDRCLTVLECLYSDVNAYVISINERKHTNLQDVAFTYGEVRFYSFVKILELASPNPDDIFYDLGSGAGKAVMIAGLAFDFKAVIGVEKLPELYNLSVNFVESLLKLPKFKRLLPDKRLAIEFIQNDFRRVDITPATIIFINATCFRGALWDDLAQKLLTTQIGTRIIIVSQTLDNVSGYELKYRGLNLMSWGLATVSLYERI